MRADVHRDESQTSRPPRGRARRLARVCATIVAAVAAGLLGLSVTAGVVVMGSGAAMANSLIGARAAARGVPLAGRGVARPYIAGPAATAVAVEQAGAGARLVFEMNETVDVRAFVLTDPDRVVVDLKETAFLLDPASGRAPALSGLIASFRFGHFAAGRSRVVVDLARPARIVKAASERTPSGGAARLVLELAPTEADTFRAAARAARAAELLNTPPAARPAPARVAQSSDLPVVALDPGHGGVDTGATGKDVEEKAIVFDFARAVAAKLAAGGKVKPILTRSADVFVALGDRVRMAQGAGAGLFVSIHADTLAETQVRGATVYTLSDRASDSEAARVAANENAADRAAGGGEAEDMGDVQDILFDLTRRETRAMSHAYARSLVAYWKNAGELNKNPIRSAGFRVLRAADMPSVLLELGYLSSEGDLSRLISSDWRERASTSVALSIERYFADKAAGSSAASIDAGGRIAEVKQIPPP